MHIVMWLAFEAPFVLPAGLPPLLSGIGRVVRAPAAGKCRRPARWIMSITTVTLYCVKIRVRRSQSPRARLIENTCGKISQNSVGVGMGTPKGQLLCGWEKDAYKAVIAGSNGDLGDRMLHERAIVWI